MMRLQPVPPAGERRDRKQKKEKIRGRREGKRVERGPAGQMMLSPKVWRCPCSWISQSRWKKARACRRQIDALTRMTSSDVPSPYASRLGRTPLGGRAAAGEKKKRDEKQKQKGPRALVVKNKQHRSIVSQSIPAMSPYPSSWNAQRQGASLPLVWFCARI